MPEWKLADAENVRKNLTKEQEDEISMLYRGVYLRIRKKVQAIPKDGTISQQLQRQQLSKLQKELDAAYKSLGIGLEKEIKKQAEKAAEAVVEESNKKFSKAGLSIEGAYSHVARDVVESIATGQVYGGNWSLSGAIWSDIDKKQADIARIIAEGTAANLSSYEIAKSLEQYVDPKAKKPWDWSKVYPGTSKKVDYNAQRLARTMVSHAYQQSLERVCKNNPFVDGYIWQSAHSNRVCPICAARDGEFFKKGELPLDHPNGMCTFIANIPDSMEQVADRLADWVEGKADPALDKWCVDFMKAYTKKAKEKEAKPKAKSEVPPKKTTSYKKLKVSSKVYKEFNEYYRKALGGLDDDLYRAIAESYTGGEYIAMNALLRTGKFDPDTLVEIANEKELRKVIEDATKAIKGIPCPENITVYRRVNSLGDIAACSKGGVYRNKQFMSSTLDKAGYKGFDGSSFQDFGDIEIEVRVPKGYSKGAFINPISMQKSEYEFLFAPDTDFDIIDMSDKKVTLQARMKS